MRPTLPRKTHSITESSWSSSVVAHWYSSATVLDLLDGYLALSKHLMVDQTLENSSMK